MISVRRLMAVGAFLSLAAALTCSHVWGVPGDGKAKGPDKGKPAEKLDRRFAEDLAVSRFTDQPVHVYQKDAKAETLFSLQVKPKLADAPARPRDVLVLVDTSASKAQGPLALAQKITEELLKKLGPKDRVALWTANTEAKDLSRGFKPAADLDGALKALKDELPLGAVNLKKVMAKAVDGFDERAGRQRVVLFLGDGKSVADPIDADERARLCAGMVKKEVAFFTVPLGNRLDPHNLHGFATGTGGRLVRLAAMESVDKMLGRLLEAVAEPVLYPSEFKLPAGVTEAYPTQLPPLRRDVGTLVVGKVKGLKALEYKLTGEVAGKEVVVKESEKVPASDSENFFLASVHGQWKGQKDRPALLQADRALALAYEQNQLARAELVAKAELALEKNNLDAAQKLYEQLRDLDPSDAAIKGGLLLVEQIRSGKRTREEVLKELKPKGGTQVTRVDKTGRKVRVLGEAEERKDDEPADPAAEFKLRRQVADSAAAALVNDAIRDANRSVRARPDDTLTYLKGVRDSIQANDDLTPSVRDSLVGRLSRSLETLTREGERVRRDQAQALELRAAADARLDLRRVETLAQDRIRERMRVFHNLMDQAREQEAYRQAQAIRRDLIDAGLPVPPAVTAGYQIGLSGYHLRELRELQRIREERWLAVLLQVEKSHVPFPDEPPVEFPAPAVWRALTASRKARYESSEFGAEMPRRAFELRDSLNKPIDFAGYDDPKITLGEVLDHLGKVYDLSFDVSERAFKFEMLNDVLKTPMADPNPIPAMRRTTLATVLKKILARVPVPSGATYLIRRDQIEITTGQFATAEKAVRVYPVADLVIPIPNAFNQQAALSQATILGTGAFVGGGIQLGLQLGGLGGGLALGLQVGGIQLGGLGGGLALGGLGGGLALGGLGGGLALGGIGGLQGGLQVGLQVGQQLGAQLGAQPGGIQVGGFNFQGNVNLGVGGGFPGFSGGQLGQLGNLGGQFGLQGGDQSQILITLVRQVVGKPKDWAIQYNPITGQPLNPLDDPGAEGGLNQDNNNIGYYPPALALVVKAPSTIHSRANNLVITGVGAGAVGFRDGKEDRVLVDGGKRPKVGVGADGEERKDPKKGPPPDPKKVWEEALVKGAQQPGLIIATADYLALNNKWDHAAEFLKANLKQGLVVEPWVYKSLAIALREGGGSAEEIERAEVSAADLEPLDGQGYLSAAKALAEDKGYDRALAFCRQAAALEPGLPHAFADAVGYAEMARDAKAMEWAAGRLLERDWPTNNADLQAKAAQKVEALARLLEDNKRKLDAERLRQAARGHQRRDLVVQLRWQGEADLDLKVTEPAGGVCSALSRQTVGGGTLIGDTLEVARGETYVAAQGFSGDYTVQVERVWGKPLGNKCQLKIIRHQGTPEETEELVTVRLTSANPKPVTVKLADGRRTETAYVPPPAALEPPADPTAPSHSSDQVLVKLRGLADPEVTGFERGLRGDVGGSGRPTAARPVTARKPKAGDVDKPLHQSKVAGFFQNTMDVTAQAAISADRRSVRLSLSPVFTGVTRVTGRPVQLVSPIFPGAPPRP